MLKSESVDKIIPALVAFRKAMKPIPRNAENPHFKHRFADLEAIDEATNELLAGVGLAVTQTMEVLTDGSSGLTTVLWHTSGQYFGGTMPLLLAKEDPQGQGSAITYARRYALSAILQLVQQDDDGNAGTAARQSSPAASRSAGARTATPNCPHCGSDQTMNSKYGSGLYCRACRASFNEGDKGNVFLGSEPDEGFFPDAQYGDS